MVRIVPIATTLLLGLTLPCVGAPSQKVDSITVLAAAALAESHCPEARGIYRKTREALEAARLLPETKADAAGDGTEPKVPGLDARVKALESEVGRMGEKAFCDMMRQQGSE